MDEIIVFELSTHDAAATDVRDACAYNIVSGCQIVARAVILDMQVLAAYTGFLQTPRCFQETLMRYAVVTHRFQRLQKAGWMTA
jgi:hypothetical protein